MVPSKWWSCLVFGVLRRQVRVDDPDVSLAEVAIRRERLVRVGGEWPRVLLTDHVDVVGGGSSPGVRPPNEAATDGAPWAVLG